MNGAMSDPAAPLKLWAMEIAEDPLGVFLPREELLPALNGKGINADRVCDAQLFNDVICSGQLRSRWHEAGLSGASFRRLN